MTTPLSMKGHIDGVFTTTTVELRKDEDGSYVDGVWVPGVEKVYTFKNVNVQPLNDLELEFFLRAEQRITDVRKLYINSGPIDSILLNDYVYFFDLRWKVIRRDVRKGLTYSKIMVDRYDDQ